ncbi:MAG TPA: hypothetical protein VJ792_00265 [Candidatus Nitrosotalea sp.]|nr:hypothetical protein [Candidatus Nitrosotalea sp.]
MNKYWNEVIAGLLRSAKSGASYEFLHEGYYLPDAKMKQYLELMEESGLARFDVIERIYTTTDKGLQFLEAFDRMEGLLYRKGNTHALEDVTDVSLDGLEGQDLTP